MLVGKRLLLACAEILTLALWLGAKFTASTSLGVPTKVTGVGSLARERHLSLLGGTISASAGRLSKSLLLLLVGGHCLLNARVDAEFLEKFDELVILLLFVNFLHLQVVLEEINLDVDTKLILEIKLLACEERVILVGKGYKRFAKRLAVGSLLDLAAAYLAVLTAQFD